MFALSQKSIDASTLKNKVINPQSGAFVCFEGWVRNHNQDKSVIELHYEAHEKLAVQVGTEIMHDAMKQFDINLAYCCHRIGSLSIGDMAIWVGVSSDHRKAAFAACEFILNQTKTKVPIWKNEFYQDGKSGWVEANL